MLPIWKLWAVLLFLLCPTHDPRRAVLKRERGNRWVTHTVTHTQSSHTDWLRDMVHRWLLESASICHAGKSVTSTHHFTGSGTLFVDSKLSIPQHKVCEKSQNFVLLPLRLKNNTGLCLPLSEFCSCSLTTELMLWQSDFESGTSSFN